MNTLMKKTAGTVLMFALLLGATPFAANAVDFGYGGDPVSCTMIANPDTIEVGGGTTLSWTLSSNVVSAVLRGKGSNSWSQNVALDGNWFISGITNSRAYTLTVTGPEGQTATCDADVTVEEDEETVPPSCDLFASPETILPNGGVMLVWDVSDNAVSAVLHPKGSSSWEQSVPLDGSWFISGIIGSRTYSLTVENANGDEYTCDADIVVESPTTGNSASGNLPSCDMDAMPEIIEINGATTLVWEGSANAVAAKLTPTGSSYVIANVTPSGSWYLSGITNTRSYSVTVRTGTGREYTCDAPVTVITTPAV